MFTLHRPFPLPVLDKVKDGHVWIVAANGDRILCTFEEGTTEYVTPTEVIGKADWVITGGTGRFAGASATIHSTAYVIQTLDPATGFPLPEAKVTTVLEGTIIY